MLVSVSLMLPVVAVLCFKVTLPILLITLVDAVAAGAAAYGLKVYQSIKSGNNSPDTPYLQPLQSHIVDNHSRFSCSHQQSGIDSKQWKTQRGA